MSMLQRIANVMKGFKRQEGQGLVEYALILCLIAIVVGFTLIYFGEALVTIYIFIEETLLGWCGCL